MDCPAGVDIPRVFSHYNFYQLTKNAVMFGNHYRSLLPKQKANNCIACGRCIDRCPQHVQIPEYMKEVAAFAAGLNM
jgi:predicted aldo/keto reductase-like oxidoreductase